MLNVGGQARGVHHSNQTLSENAKYLDPHFGLAPLKSNPGKPSKMIIAEEDVPSNFTHLGQYAFTLRNRILEKKKNQKKDKEKQAHCNDAAEVFNDPVVYFTIANTTNLQPCALIDCIRTEWEMHGGGKLQVKDLQSHDSKVMFALSYVYKDTHIHIIKKTLEDIVHKSAELLLFQMMAPDKEYNEPNLPQISIRPQVPHLKVVDTSGYDKLPYNVRKNRKAFHIKARPEDKRS